MLGNRNGAKAGTHKEKSFTKWRDPAIFSREHQYSYKDLLLPHEPSSPFWKMRHDVLRKYEKESSVENQNSSKLPNVESCNEKEPSKEQKACLSMTDLLCQSSKNSKYEGMESEEHPVMNVKLKPHQLSGLLWLKHRESHPHIGGILADDMGLGKTIQMIALMIANKSNDKKCRSTLIIVPLAIIDQWKTEIAIKGSSAIKVFLYHGPKRKDRIILSSYDVVLTTYQSNFITDLQPLHLISMT